ncbi:phosphomannomutase/phosphoglucomutase [Candidatus Parcubacteria bacterium]|nr:MAG: phosphomannomutase/phosphoglucomutase [Candidatus Parcubacteria bacterium]
MAYKENLDAAIFKAYDIRGIYPGQINEQIVNLIAQTYLKFLSDKLNKPIKDLKLVVCRDIRKSSEPILNEAIKVFLQYGATIDNLGLVSINDYYFAVGHYGYDGGFLATASHNPPQYGGVKMAYKNINYSDSIDFVSGKELYQILQNLDFPLVKEKEKVKGTIQDRDISADHLEHIFSFIDNEKLKPLKVVVDTGNGMNGLLLPKIFSQLPCELIHLFPELDGDFPNRAPNPLTAGAPDKLAAKIKEVGADLGFICDVDGDRINLLDEQGNFYKGDMSMLPMTKAMLDKYPGAGIVYNLICSHSVKDMIKKWGGQPIRSEVGYMNLARHMREENGVMSGEVSAHFAFKKNYYADNAFIALVLTLAAISQDGRKVSEIMKDYSLYAKSEEMNFTVDNIDLELDKIRDYYRDNILDEIDGITVEAKDWWFNVRASNTEPLLRVTVEAISEKVLKQKIAEVLGMIDIKK